ncbi:MAG: hypothetical protein LBP42_02900, partial [Treponema sp.]|nr:hypothetical protein [Treponema sp.]
SRLLPGETGYLADILDPAAPGSNPGSARLAGEAPLPVKPPLRRIIDAGFLLEKQKWEKYPVPNTKD